MGFDDLHRELVQRLGSLEQGSFLILGEPVPEPERSGLFGRKPKPPPTRYVQFLRDPRHLYGECVGSTWIGGDWEISEAEHDRLRMLGWLAPGDPDPAGTQPAYPNYWVTVDEGRAADLATMATGALSLLGADPATLEWRTA
ncbi:hypothetical protein ABLE68_13585 [Nocardioides sp. CN2-186]|uniref:TY-Chap domain-containing protein n=1 Tax=Nocardioides tweenelious TaxID=3156607 RepID=UPI0032B5EEB0